MKRQTTMRVLSLLVAVTLAACGGGAQVPPTLVVEIPTSSSGSAATNAPPTATTEAATATTRAPAGQGTATQSSSGQPSAATVVAATNAVSTTAASSPTPAEGVGGGGGAQGIDGSIVVLANFSIDPPQLTAVDPATGEAEAIFSAPGLRESFSQWVADGYLFYIDDETQVVKRVAFDNTLTELPFVNSGGELFEGQFLPSPNGERIAWGTSVFEPHPEGDTHIQLKAANADGSDEQFILDKRLPDEAILPQPIGWSPEGRYLYFTNPLYGIGGYILFFGGSDLQQADLKTGLVKEILPNMDCLCAMSLSPDGSTVAYIPGVEQLELVLHDVASGAEQRVPIDVDHHQAGGIIWSPDGGLLMYTMAVGNPDSEAYSVVKVDVATMSQTVLIQDDDRLLQTILWPVTDTVWLNDASGSAWRMDTESGALTKADVPGGVVRAGW
ncbi:MAG: hypothetical protein HYZ49_10440 [Chloroflexi bacterium]|nr:hypothetical protein [Chloroflexota bacterium]